MCKVDLQKVRHLCVFLSVAGHLVKLCNDRVVFALLFFHILNIIHYFLIIWARTVEDNENQLPATCCLYSGGGYSLKNFINVVMLLIICIVLCYVTRWREMYYSEKCRQLNVFFLRLFFCQERCIRNEAEAGWDISAARWNRNGNRYCSCVTTELLLSYFYICFLWHRLELLQYQGFV